MKQSTNPFWHSQAALERLVGARVFGVDLPAPDWIIDEDWREPPLVSLLGGEARIVLVLAANRGQGAFRRLVDGITAAGLRPVVVCPVLADMPRIMARWGWQRTTISYAEEWRPPVAKRGEAA